MYQGVKTWNPLAGECPHRCIYCSTKKFMRYPQFKEKYTGKLRLWETAFKPLGKGKTIFVCAQNDLFATGIPYLFINKIFAHCLKYSENTYMIQTKNVRNLSEWYHNTYLKLSNNFIFGTTIENNYFDKYTGGNIQYHRAQYLSEIDHKRFITIEPIMKFNLAKMVEICKIAQPFKVYIGADSGKNNLPEPSSKEIIQLMTALKNQVQCEVEIKSNLQRLLK